MSELARWKMPLSAPNRIIIWGAGDQGRVNIHILRALGHEIVAFVDDTPELASPVPGVPLFQGWPGLESFLCKTRGTDLGYVIAIGNPNGSVRLRLHQQLLERGLQPVSFADPTALLCSSSKYGEGLQVMAMAVVHNEAEIGTQCILNTRSLIEHDCRLMKGVEIAPGAVLCGRVTVGENTWIGANATIAPRIRIGANSIVGAGSLVIADVPDNVVMAGVPARLIREIF